MSEPTSALTFQDLIVEVARKIGVAYYGANGDEEAQVPVDPHDLAECKRHVNNAIRMFIADAPPSGWRWTQPVASVVLWPSVAESDDVSVSGGAYDGPNDETVLTATGDSFYPTMELKTIAIDGVGSFTIKRYISATSVAVTGDASGANAAKFSIEADGNYTLPHTFSGQYLGDITYAADTNRGVSIEWTTEAVIRQWRENSSNETGDPFWAAVRVMSSGDPRRRWELVVYPKPDEVVTVEFPFDLHFDKLVDLTETSPAPYSHDEAIKAACLAIVEKDVENALGPDWDYYQRVALPNSHRIDSRSAPRKLGYFGNPRPISGTSAVRFFRQNIYSRPTVRFNP